MVELSAGKDTISLANALDKVAYYLRKKDTPSQAGVIFLAGGTAYTDGLHPQSVRAAELYKEHYAENIVIATSGGSNAGDLSKSEHLVLQDELLTLGVPDNAVIAEPLGGNTLTEAESGLVLMEKSDIAFQKGILLATTSIHSRRAFLTWQHVLQQFGVRNENGRQPNQIPLFSCPSNEFINKSDPKVMERMYGEILRLIVYKLQGNLTHEQIPYDILQATAVIANKTRTDQFRHFAGYINTIRRDP